MARLVVHLGTLRWGGGTGVDGRSYAGGFDSGREKGTPEVGDLAGDCDCSSNSPVPGCLGRPLNRWSKELTVSRAIL